MITHTLRYLRALADNRARRPGAPRFLTFIVTFSCNARCIMCDSWRKPSPDDLTLEEIDRIFAQLPPLDAVRLTGGEPFARADLGEIAALVRKRLRPLFLHVTTNGFLTARIVEFVERRDRALPLQLLVSVDGLKEKHNHVRGRDTAWDGVMMTLHALAPRQRELNLKLMVNQTIVDAEGAAHYPLLREVLRPLGVRHNMVMAYDASATYSVEEEAEVAPGRIGEFATFGEFGEEQLRALLDEVERDLEEAPLADPAGQALLPAGHPQPAARGRGRAEPAVRGAERAPAAVPQRRRADLPVQHAAGGQPAAAELRGGVAGRGGVAAAVVGDEVPGLLGGVRGAAVGDLHGRPRAGGVGSVATAARCRLTG